MIFIVFNIYSVDESDLQRDEVAIIKVFVKYIYMCQESWTPCEVTDSRDR